MHYGLGWCRIHYRRFKSNGDPLVSQLDLPPERLFWAKVKKTDGCWLWTGSATSADYGMWSDRRIGRQMYVHRRAYEWLVGPIPEGMVLDHLCRVTLCVNPEHLEAVPQAENQRRGLNGVLKTHCPQGHEWVPANWYYRKTGRYCAVCARDRARKVARSA